MSNGECGSDAVKVDLANLRQALDGLAGIDPADVGQAAMLEAVASLRHGPEPRPEALKLAQVREIGAYFQDGFQRCAVLAQLLTGKIAVRTDDQGRMTMVPVPTEPVAAEPTPAAPIPAQTQPAQG